MENDERINMDVKKAKSLGYTIFWFGIFASLLYRWFYVNETLMNTLDIFLVWVIASLVQFFTLAVSGIPITYPVSMNQKEQLYFILLVPLFSGLLAVMISFFFKLVDGFNYLLLVFGRAYFSTLFLFIFYKTILYFWERKNIE
ncbi:hypothetical protein [Candidatus Contubernalis alkaliaceticus]|uniref:hypothetical protein n=1 Tax=Candidatus Contubernalis alkaliaceticus TaxID=338645 RepID=UPI001F4C3E7A|nr:hypothetical protein [Candidatus Contubernalis alkalaceticus]UNC90822.1 hypothetical protein HUE98_01215 [Candidatus Contubernalis alkalaceticus]